MKALRRLNAFAFLTMSLLCGVSMADDVDVAKELQRYMEQAFPDAKIAFTGEHEGTITGADGVVRFETVWSPMVKDSSGTEALVMAVAFPDDNEKAIQEFSETGVVKYPARKSLLLFASANNQGKIHKVELDHATFATKDFKLEISDFAGLGEQQVWCEYEALYCFADPIERRIARRMLLISTTDARTVLKTTLGVTAIGEDDAVKDASSRLHFSQGTAGSPREASLVDIESGVVRATSNFLGGKYVFSNVPDAETRTNKDRHALAHVPTTIKLRVVNAADGVPVPGAKVKTKSEIVSLLFGDSASIESEGKTDVDGWYTFSAKDGFSGDVRKEGFYSERLYLEANQVGDGSVTVMLTPLARPVAMIRNAVKYLNTGEKQDRYEFSVRIVAEGEDPLLVSGLQGGGDFEFEYQRQGPRYGEELPGGVVPLNMNWHLTVRGKNGWLLAPVPENTNWTTENSTSMRIAPEAGYVAVLTYPIQTNEYAFFVKSAVPSRYGKFYGVHISESKNPEKPRIQIRMEYLIQESAVESTSLNPLDK